MTSFDPSSAFASGTFRPHPHPAPILAMLRSQGRIEATLFLRHGEQLLLSFIIPLCMLLAAATLPLLPDPKSLQAAFPVILAVAAMSSGFTGQAIALAFDRRYGALKRIGASGVPAKVIIIGKIIGLLIVATFQVCVLSLVAYGLGWHVAMPGFLLGLGVFFVGVASFTSLGMFMGGTLPSELVLGLANLIWVVFVGAASYVVFSISAYPAWLITIPSVALAEGIHGAFQGSIPLSSFISLGLWMLVGVVCASRWFKFAD
ncbi:ABC transporter permease [Corynebacterium sp. HS2168-gen11]|uniref:ABC transporter permease n=1 Tax=Corynebacterium sp. HS2168-gen11 TaxID=2974027 RepID=UPI00216AB9F0|nr:ABC transporter permease [Corynebacterium sp. HS2168-gen11]MCS4535126.1 ABC transporter permease [Corynebacterium sp. HS2168-gen11]